MEEAARRLVSLHRELWQGRNIGPEHLTQKFESYMVAVVQRMSARGLGGLSEFWRDGVVIISQFWVFGRDFVGAYTIGASREARQRYQFSSLYVWEGLNIARSRSCSQLNLGRGSTPDKLRWNPRVVSNRRLILSRRRAVWVFYTGYQILRSKVKEYANSETAPQWVQSVLASYRILRRRAALRSGSRHKDERF